MKLFRFLSFLGLLIFAHIAYGAEKVEEKPLEEPNLSRKSDSAGTNEAKSETPTASTDENTSEDDKKYALGSLCNYCTYCKVGIYSCILCIASVLKFEDLAKVSDKPEVLPSSDPDQSWHAACRGQTPVWSLVMSACCYYPHGFDLALELSRRRFAISAVNRSAWLTYRKGNFATLVSFDRLLLKRNFSIH